MELVGVGVLALVVGVLVGILVNSRIATDRAWRQKSEFDIERTRWEGELKSAQDRTRDFESVTAENAKFGAELAELRTSTSREVATLQATLAGRSREIERLEGDVRDARGKLATAEDALGGLRTSLAERDASAASETKAAQDKLDLLLQARKELSDQFAALSADTLDAQSRKFTEATAISIGTLLNPVKTKLGDFQAKVEAFQTQHQTTAAALQVELKHLGDVSSGMTQEAANLTRALTSQSQVRGAWGEQVLRRVLEVAGLREGQDFAVQEVHRLADGSLPRPDVIVNLPGGRRIVVDSKLSLVDYIAHTVGEDDGERASALKRHVSAVRQHIRELSDKDYTQVLGKGALDFVIAFIPIEQAYLAAVESDNSLYDDAWKRHVMFACPSTLLYALRMVAYLWTQEAQERNVEDIVKRGAELYDKFVGFTTDLLSVGTALEKAQGAYDGAINKLATGKGNVVRQAEMLREFGVKPSKRIAASLLDHADADGAIAVPSLTEFREEGNAGTAATMDDGAAHAAPGQP